MEWHSAITNNMIKAEYNYKLIPEHKVVAIVDLNKGNMSVTNQIEEVVAAIATKESIVAKHWQWIYRDTENIYDGWDPTTEQFILLGAHSLEAALELVTIHA